MARADLFCLSEAFSPLLCRYIIRFLFCTRSPSPNTATNSEESSLPPADSGPVGAACPRLRSTLKSVFTTPLCTSREIMNFKNRFILSFHPVGYIAKHTLNHVQRHATSTGKYRATGLSLHSFSSQICHPAGPALLPARGPRGHFVPQPTGAWGCQWLQTPAPGLPRQVGEQKAPLPPILLLWAGEPMELG